MEATAAVAGQGGHALVFIGFMGAGKTTAARAAAGGMGARATDSDHLIEERLGMQIEDYFARHGLPRHPLEADGFTSIGCMPCSSRTLAGEGPRAGRWRGLYKSECGIHLDLPASLPREE